MGAVPKERVSRARQGNRRSHDKIQPLNLTECPQCHTPRRPHHVCPNCGTYRGREVVPAGKAGQTS